MAHHFNIHEDQTVAFGAKVAGSETFKTLFKEGMGLVEEAAAYLDGKGREDARALKRMEALAYASESMRLTTRLMQLASWLLLQRAVNEGELTQEEASSEKRKVRLNANEPTSSEEMMARLPDPLREMIYRSVRLQSRILLLDQMIFAAPVSAAPRAPTPSPVAGQLAQLQAAFGSR